MIGIYKIIINNKFYVGSSFDLERRLIQHKSDLNRRRHDNLHLQKAYDKYGEFNYEIIETFENILDKELRIKEKMWKEQIGYYNIQDPTTHFGLKPVFQFDKTGAFIREYSSPIEAAKTLNISYNSIIHAAQENEHETRTAGGFFWRYTKEIEIIPDKRCTPIYVYNIDGSYLKEFYSLSECVSTMFPNENYAYAGIINVCNNICASYRGFRISKEKLDKLDNTKLLSISKSYSVIQISIDGKTKIKVWPTAKAAADFIGVKSCEITQACKKNSRVKGYRWTRLGTKLSELLETQKDIKTKTELETTNGNV